MGVLFDAAFGDTLDDLLSLCLLYGLDNRNECRVASLSTSKDSLGSAGLLDLMQKLYGGRPAPIGMTMGNPARAEESAMLKAALAGQSIAVKNMLDTAEPHNLMRNALTAQYDGTAAVICTGPADNLVALLKLPGARPVVAAKVKTLYLVGEDPRPVLDWPTPMVMVTSAMARELTYVPKAGDFEWNERHPVAQALGVAGDAKLNRAGMLAVLHAVRGKDFPLPLVAGQAAIVDKLLAELVVAKPIPRQRVRPFAAD